MKAGQVQPSRDQAVHCSQTQQLACTQALEETLYNPKRLKLSARGSKFTSVIDMIERALAKESRPLFGTDLSPLTRGEPSSKYFIIVKEE